MNATSNNAAPYLPARRRFSIWIVAASIFTGGASAAPLEELIVTATKRERNLQDVPIAISAFGSRQLRDAGVHDIRDLQMLSPSLVISNSQAESAGTVARIRGVGTTGDNLGLESSVAVFVDGVYRNRNNVALTELGDIERIEVLRGPQGTLFGKNASAGLIHIITEGPDTEQWGGHAEGSYGDYSAYRLGAGVTGPIIGEQLAFRLDGSYTKRDEGFIKDTANPGVEYNDRDRYLLRGQLSSSPNENLDIRLIADYAERRETCCGGVTRIAGPTAGAINLVTAPTPGVILPPAPFDRDMTSNANRGYVQDVDEGGGSLTIDWDVFTGQITSITAYRSWDATRSQDGDYTSADLLYRQIGTYQNKFETLTQELRFAATVGRLDYLFGFYYVDEDLTFRDAVRGGADFNTYIDVLQIGSGEMNLLPPGTFLDGQGVLGDTWLQTTESWAIFMHDTFHATDKLDLTLGLRYTDEDKKLNGTVTSNNPACLQIVTGMITVDTLGAQLTCNPLINPTVDGIYLDNRNDGELTGTLNISYTFTDGWMGYGSFSSGYKAGGYNLDRAGLANPLLGGVPMASDLEFRPETVNAYELGAKGSVGDWITTSIALFYEQFDDFQLNEFTGTAFIVTNLEEVTTKGVEVDFSAAPTDGLQLNGGIVYQDARYGDNVSNPALAGQRLTNAPLWVITASGRYGWNWSASLRSWVFVDYRFNSDMNTGSDLAPEKEQASYALWGARAGFGDVNDRWSVELWGKNLLDQDYIQVAFDAPLQSGTIAAFLGDPLTWGATVRVNF